MDSKKNRHSVDVVFVLLVVCLFAVCSLFIILLGGQVYQGIQNHTEENYDSRTGLAYVVNKVRAYDESGVISVGENNGVKTLVFTQNEGKQTYYTFIYFYDGSLREIVLNSNKSFDLSSGDAIVAAQGLDLIQNGNQITIKITGITAQVFSCTVTLRSESLERGT